MKFLVTFLRQLGRPLIVLHVLLLGAMVLFLALVASSTNVEEPIRKGWVDLHLLHLNGLLIAPVYAGYVCGLARMQALVCGFSWMAPGLRRQLDVAVGVMGVAAATFFAALFEGAGGAVGWLPAFCLAFAWFAFGTSWLSLPAWRWRAPLTISAMVLGVATFGAVVHVAREHSMLVSLLALLAGSAISLVSASRSNHRRLVVTPGYALDRAVAPPADRTLGESRPLSRTRRSASTSHLGLVHACLYEQFGRYRGGLVGRVFVIAAPIALWLLVIFGLPVGVDGASVASFWREVYHVLVAPLHPVHPPGDPSVGRAPEPWIIAAFLGVWFSMAALASRTTFLAGRLYPVSRGDRARAAWGAGASTCGATVLAVGLYLSVFASLAAIFGPGPVSAVPSFVRPLLLCAIATPFLQRFGIARITVDNQKRHRAGLVVDCVFVGAFYAIGITLLDVAWRRTAPAAPEAALYAGALALLVLSWWHHRRALGRWYATADLA